jgi:hypothetical protein
METIDKTLMEGHTLQMRGAWATKNAAFKVGNEWHPIQQAVAFDVGKGFKQLCVRKPVNGEFFLCGWQGVVANTHPAAYDGADLGLCRIPDGLALTYESR